MQLVHKNKTKLVTHNVHILTWRKVQFFEANVLLLLKQMTNTDKHDTQHILVFTWSHIAIKTGRLGSSVLEQAKKQQQPYNTMREQNNRFR